MNLRTFLFPILASLAWAGTASADIVGSDFSDSAVFNAAGGNYDNSLGSVDDLDATDNISVSGWSFNNAGGLQGQDPSAAVGMPSDNVVKFNGDTQGQPAVGTSGSGLATHSFSVTIPAGTTLDLLDVTFDWRQATPGGTNVRWLGFDTSLDSGLIWSEVGLIRNAFDSQTISLAGPTYQGLTNQTVTFNFYAGGTGTGDIDIDTIVVDGIATTSVPEPTTALPLTAVAIGLFSRRRKK